jgi:hypothetical protein
MLKDLNKQINRFTVGNCVVLSPELFGRPYINKWQLDLEGVLILSENTKTVRVNVVVNGN